MVILVAERKGHLEVMSSIPSKIATVLCIDDVYAPHIEKDNSICVLCNVFASPTRPLKNLPLWKEIIPGLQMSVNYDFYARQHLS